MHRTLYDNRLLTSSGLLHLGRTHRVSICLVAWVGFGGHEYPSVRPTGRSCQRATVSWLSMGLILLLGVEFRPRSSDCFAPHRTSSRRGICMLRMCTAKAITWSRRCVWDPLFKRNTTELKGQKCGARDTRRQQNVTTLLKLTSIPHRRLPL